MEPMRGKVALITGGSSGIGRGTALGLAKLGAAIAVASRNEQALQETAGAIRNAGAQALIVPTDVTDSDQCRRAIEATVEHFGRLDILVCSAGVSMRAYLEHSNLAAMDRVMRVNFFGTLYATYYAIAHVKKTRGSL